MIDMTIRDPLEDLARSIGNVLGYAYWRLSGGQSLPPNSAKRRIILEIARQCEANVLVETGTYKGDTVNASRHAFSRILSIELDRRLYERAKRRFARFSNVEIVLGDSGKILPSVLAKIDGRCLIWLDSHYSGGATAKGDLETPVLEELRHISEHLSKHHVILIDDARLFVGKNDYPTLETLKSVVEEEFPGYSFKTEYDIIELLPPKSLPEKQDSF